MKKSFNIQELLHCKSKCHGTKPMHPSLSRSFQKHQERDLKHAGLMDLTTTKQNKLPSFIDRSCLPDCYGQLIKYDFSLTWFCGHQLYYVHF